jgi:Mn2+/Fe2+ NRAMP family transporter
VLLFTAVLLGFAGLYVGTEIFASTKTPLDAIYVSVFTLALTDYSPKAGYGQLVVMSEVVNGVLLIVALFPLLISRISTFKD